MFANAKSRTAKWGFVFLSNGYSQKSPIRWDKELPVVS